MSVTIRADLVHPVVKLYVIGHEQRRRSKTGDPNVFGSKYLPFANIRPLGLLMWEDLAARTRGYYEGVR